MSNLTKSLNLFEESFNAVYGDATVSYYSLDSYDDNVVYPLLEMELLNSKRPTLSQIQRTSYTLRFSLTLDSKHKKNTSESFEERLVLKNELEDMLYSWHFDLITSRALGVGEMSNINVVRLASLDKGETGSLAANRVRVEIDFDLSILEA